MPEETSRRSLLHKTALAAGAVTLSKQLLAQQAGSAVDAQPAWQKMFPAGFKNEKVKTDPKQEGSPVVALNLGGTDAKDADLATLKAFTHLQELDLLRGKGGRAQRHGVREARLVEHDGGDDEANFLPRWSTVLLSRHDQRPGGHGPGRQLHRRRETKADAREIVRSALEEHHAQ